LLSLLFFNLRGYWHFYRLPWGQSLPGKLGFSWVFAVEGSWAVGTVLAILSLTITIAVYRSKGAVQGLVCLPTSALAVLWIGIV
jgi:hypothetical protein